MNKSYLIARLGERSTWTGLFLVLSSLGIYNADPAVQEHATAIAIGAYGLLNALLGDKLR